MGLVRLGNTCNCLFGVGRGRGTAPSLPLSGRPTRGCKGPTPRLFQNSLPHLRVNAFCASAPQNTSNTRRKKRPRHKHRFGPKRRFHVTWESNVNGYSKQAPGQASLPGASLVRHRLERDNVPEFLTELLYQQGPAALEKVVLQGEVLRLMRYCRGRSQDGPPDLEEPISNRITRRGELKNAGLSSRLVHKRHVRHPCLAGIHRPPQQSLVYARGSRGPWLPHP